MYDKIHYKLKKKKNCFKQSKKKKLLNGNKFERINEVNTGEKRCSRKNLQR